MRRVNWLASVGAMAVIAGAGQAMAQQDLRIGGRVSGALEDGDATAADDLYIYDDYRFTARAGQRVEAVLRSDAFDSYLEVFAEGDTETALASDDDGLGDGLHARLRFTPQAAGTYVLRARTLGGTEGGAYSLTLNERRAARPPRPGSIRLGQTVRGSIDDRDPEADAGPRYDAYVFRGQAGQRIALRLTAEDFDPIVRIGRGLGEEFAELASNDDWGGELNSYLIYALPEDGDYVVRAAALANDGRGAYSLELTQAPPPPPSTPIAFDQTVDGELSSDDGLSVDGQRADLYRFTAEADQRVRIGMSSDVFDTYIALTDADGAPLAQDDDGAGEGTDSRLTFTVPAAGEYVIEARAFSGEAEGDYTLKLEALAPEAPPVALPYGETLRGEITDQDGTDDVGRAFDAYTFTGEEGQRIQAIMRSGDFDTFLSVSSAGGEFAELASDDDGLGQGTDSRLNFTLPSTGDYVLRASPLGPGADGLYSIELIDRGPEPVDGSILVGETGRGSLTENDSSAPDGSFFDAYRFEAKEGDRLIVTMVSNDFDAFVTVGREPEGGEYEVLGHDDDGLSDTHARLEWEVPSDGTYVLRAGSFAQAETGDYAVTIERKPQTARD